MNNNRKNIIHSYLIIVLTAILCHSNLVYAVEKEPDFISNFPSGLACEFPLKIEGWNGNQQIREMFDKHNILRIISAGTGSTLRFTNETTGKTFVLKSNGVATIDTTYNSEGNILQKDVGHTVLIFFPTDDPPGPSTTLYVGQVTVLIDPNWNFTFQSAQGKETDMCAVVSDES